MSLIQPKCSDDVMTLVLKKDLISVGNPAPLALLTCAVGPCFSPRALGS